MPPEMFHGAEVIDASTPAQPLRTVRTAVIGIVGAAKDVKAPGRRNVPVLLRSRAEAASTFDGPLGDYIDILFRMASTLIVAVNVFDPDTHIAPSVTVEVTFAAGAPIAIPAAVGAAIVSVKSQDGATTYDVNDDWTWAAATGTLTRVGAGDIDAAGTVAVTYNFPDVPSPLGADAAAATGAENQESRTGIYALLDAESETGVRPGILIAPDFSGRQTAAGADPARGAGLALEAVANRLRSSFAVDYGPKGAARSVAVAARALYSSRRGQMCYRWLEILDAAGKRASVPPSVVQAGVIAASDLDPGRGFWWSPSNVRVPLVVGTDEPVSWGPSDASADATVLDAAQVATIARIDGVFRTWGNRSLAPDDTAGRFRFFAVGRVADAVGETLVREHLKYVDNPSQARYWDEVASGVAAYLRTLRNLGAIRSGSIVASDANTQATLDAGQAIWRVTIDPPPPMERLTFELAVASDSSLSITEIR